MDTIIHTDQIHTLHNGNCKQCQSTPALLEINRWRMCILGSMKESHAQICSLQLIDLNCNYDGKTDFFKSQDGIGSASPAVVIMQLSLLLRTN